MFTDQRAGRNQVKEHPGPCTAQDGFAGQETLRHVTDKGYARINLAGNKLRLQIRSNQLQIESSMHGRA